MQLAICWKTRVSGATTQVVTKLPVRTISRKGQVPHVEPSTTLSECSGAWNPQRPYASHLGSTTEAKIWS